jgi:hypothetical protein
MSLLRANLVQLQGEALCRSNRYYDVGSNPYSARRSPGYRRWIPQHVLGARRSPNGAVIGEAASIAGARRRLAWRVLAASGAGVPDGVRVGALPLVGEHHRRALDGSISAMPDENALSAS